MISNIDMTKALLGCVKRNKDYIYNAKEDAYALINGIFKCSHLALDTVIVCVDKNTKNIDGVVIAKARPFKNTTKLALENMFQLSLHHSNELMRWYGSVSGKNFKEDIVDADQYIKANEFDSDVFYNFINTFNKELSPRYIPGRYVSLKKTEVNAFALEFEKELGPLAQKSYFVKRFHGLSPARESRTEFQRDKERILHSKAFRRMVDKAQIFTSSKGG